MLSNEVIDKVIDRLVLRIEQGNEYILKKMGESVKRIGTLTPSQAQQLSQILKYGGDYEKIANELAKITGLNVNDIYKIFEEVAKNDYRFAGQFYKYRNINYPPYDKNIALKNMVNSIAQITANEYINLSNTSVLGYAVKNELGDLIFKDIKQTYHELIDEAILNVSQGKESFDSAMYSRLKQIGDSGLRVVYPTTYIGKDGKEHNYTRRLDSAMRMNIQDGIRQLHNETQQQFGKEFNADGIEVTVHLNPAPDHENVQGHQFSKEEFEKFQNDEDCYSYDGEFYPAIADETGYDRRSIGQYNCYHNIFEIILGISKPEYTKEQLHAIIDDNHKGFDFEGKHYTNYQGTQLQRRIELEIRKAKDDQIIGKASGNTELINKSQQRITLLTDKYKQLNEASGLPNMIDRARVSGYRRLAISNKKEIEYARENNYIWHSTESLEEIIKTNKIISPSIAVGKRMTGKVKFGTQFIEFKPELLENINKETILYRGDGGNAFSGSGGKFKTLMQQLKDTPKIYNELKFLNDIDSLKYIKRVYIRQDEPQKIIDLLKEYNIKYTIYKDFRVRGLKKKKLQ